jgi:hypothetical protein
MVGRSSQSFFIPVCSTHALARALLLSTNCEDVLDDLVMEKSPDAAGIFATFGHRYVKVPDRNLSPACDVACVRQISAGHIVLTK